MFKDIIEHVKVDRAYENFYPQLQSILVKVFSNANSSNIWFVSCALTESCSCLLSLDFTVPTCSDLLASEKFLPFFDLFHKESFKVDISKSILQTFARVQLEPTDNGVAMNALLYVARVCFTVQVVTCHE